MFFSYCGVKIHYRFSGKGKICLFLHGWGQNCKAFSAIEQKLPEATWLAVDFPPFGKSGEPENWTLFTYANMVISLCEQLNVSSCTVVGHSFGGRVAILLAALKPELVEKLVLVSSAGMKPKRKIKYYFDVAKYKIFKFFGVMPQNAGSDDYRALPKSTKATFVSVVNTFLEEYCPQIQAPTLLVFGRDDIVTPLYMAKRLNKLIKGSKLVVIEHAGHFCYEDRPIKVAEILSDFLKEEK